VLGGVRRQEESRADLLLASPASLVCRSRSLSLRDKRRTPQEANSSGCRVEVGEGGHEGDGGEAPEVVQGDWRSQTAAGKETTSIGDVSAASRLASARSCTSVGLASMGRHIDQLGSIVMLNDQKINC